MKKWVNLLRGTVVVTGRGNFPERLINLCAQRRVTFWGVDWREEGAVTFSILRQDFKRVQQLAGQAGCELERGRGGGLPSFLGRFRKRYAFLAGFGLSLLCVAVLSNVIFRVQVEGNYSVPTAQILGELRRQGLRPGVYGPGLDTNQLAQEALLELDGLSWMTVNLYGTRAQVIVREAVEKPELIEDEGCSDLVATADGLIVEMETLSGQAKVKKGDTVAKGDILISGTVELKPPPYSDQPTRYYQTRAMGKVTARTWRTLEGKIPLTAFVKDYTGEETQRASLMVFGYSVDFYRNSSISWPFYDKIKTVYPLGGNDSESLPAAWVTETLRAYQPREISVDRDSAQTLLETQLDARLRKLIGPDGTVESARCAAQVKDGWLFVTLHAECRERIDN